MGESEQAPLKREIGGSVWGEEKSSVALVVICRSNCAALNQEIDA